MIILILNRALSDADGKLRDRGNAAPIPPVFFAPVYTVYGGFFNMTNTEKVLVFQLQSFLVREILTLHSPKHELSTCAVATTDKCVNSEFSVPKVNG